MQQVLMYQLSQTFPRGAKAAGYSSKRVAGPCLSQVEGDASQADEDGAEPQRPVAAAERDDDEAHHVQHDACRPQQMQSFLMTCITNLLCLLTGGVNPRAEAACFHVATAVVIEWQPCNGIPPCKQCNTTHSAVGAC